MNADLIVRVIKLLCPFLHEMADRTDNDFDNVIVDIICRLLGEE